MTQVPTWDKFMAPSLEFLSDGRTYRAREVRNAVAEKFQLSDAARSEMISSGQRRWENRANWALSYLGRYGAAERPVRGSYSITDAGRRLLERHPGGITARHLEDELGPPVVTDETVVFTQTANPEEAEILDPVEQIDSGIARIHSEVATDLLRRLHSREPAFFEEAVLHLLIAMGYGGAEGTATRTQLVNDEGIDGVVDQDALGLSRIYVQAKRYALDSSVQRPEIQGFVGALHGKQASQGVFITTGRFSGGARDYASSVASRVVLIDGPRLAGLMIRYGVGVQTKRTVHVVEVDEDFFE